MSVEGGIVQGMVFIIFLGIRVYYGFKLIVLIRSNDVLRYRMLSWFGLVRLGLRILVMLVIVNIHIGLVVGFGYRVFEFKYFVYILILGYVLVSWVNFNKLIFVNRVLRVVLKDGVVLFWYYKLNFLDIKFFLSYWEIWL